MHNPGKCDNSNSTCVTSVNMAKVPSDRPLGFYYTYTVYLIRVFIGNMEQ